MAKIRRFTIWRGPSELDGKPIMLVATFGARQRANRKTGRKASVYIPVHGVEHKVTRFNNLIQIGGAT